MRYALMFLMVAVAVYVYRDMLTKRDRRTVHGRLRRALVPVAAGAVAVVLLLIVNLNTNGKIL